MSLSITDSKGGIETFSTTILVMNKIRIDDIELPPNGDYQKSFKLYGTAGEPIIYSAGAGGTTSSIEGFVRLNGIFRDLVSGNQTVSNVNAGIFPASGYVDGFISINNSANGGFGNASMTIQSSGGCNSTSISVQIGN